MTDIDSLRCDHLLDILANETGQLCVQDGKLTELGQRLCAALLSRATSLPNMEWPVLEVIWKRRLLPMQPMELVILDQDPIFSERGPSKVLLTRRRDTDPDFPGMWHHPGGYLGGGETVEQAILRVLKRELGEGHTEVRVCHAVCPLNLYGLARDHEAGVLFAVFMGTNPAPIIGAREWFPVTALPAETIPHHRKFQQRVNEWMQAMRNVRAHAPHLVDVLLDKAGILQLGDPI